MKLHTDHFRVSISTSLTSEVIDRFSLALEKIVFLL